MVSAQKMGRFFTGILSTKTSISQTIEAEIPSDVTLTLILEATQREASSFI
jgi:hypothetical protein